jgi:two-component system sensor histidine kinase UhpB
MWRHPIRRSAARVPLFWRIFAVNAVVLAAATAVLALSPITVSNPVVLVEAVLLAAGVAVMLVVNLLLLRRVLEPLASLTALMRTIDPLRPGERIRMSSPDTEVHALTEAFNDMLERLEGERRESGLRALGAQEAERRRLARELHDEIGQSLTGVVLQLERTARQARDPDVRGNVEEARETARHSLDDVRRIARELRPEALDDLGLASALTSLATGLAKRTGLQVTRSLAGDLPPMSAEAELVIYRVAQESLTNVARHAKARRVDLALEHSPGCVRLRVRDDGRGMVPGSAGPINGIRGMRERAVLIGARLYIDSQPSAGTEVRLEVPQAGASP